MKGLQNKLALSIVITLLYFSSHAQNLSDSIYINTDSIEKELDLFLELYEKKKTKSYFSLSLSLNNTQLSVNNFALNAQQNSPGITLSPSVEYYHKSGLNITYNNFFLINEATSGVIQHSINPGYVFSKNKRFDFGLFYTYFINNAAFSKFATPYQHDALAYLQWNSPWIQPSVSIGYSTGIYEENNETNEKLVISRPFRGDTTIQFKVYDSLKMNIQDISSTFTLRKRFIFEGKKNNRYIVFTPSVLAMFIQNNYDVTYNSVSQFSPRTQMILRNRPQLAQNLRKQLYAQFPNINQTRSFLNSMDFVLQSIGINLTATAYYGSFFVSPRCYLDCYLLSSENKFNMFFSLQTGITF